MFDRALTIFRVWGIPIRLHWSLLLFLPYVAIAATNQFDLIAAWTGVPVAELRVPPLAWGVILAVGLFVGILLHELAHTIVALHGGAKIQSITLMMLGGVTQMREEVRAEREAWMAFAGPLASFGLAVVAFAAFRFLPLTPGLGVATLAFAVTNATIGLFNLVPAFPMDGGRILRGLLAPRIGRARATRIATSVGKATAILFGFWGLARFNVLLVLIAGFIYMAASAERARLEARDLLHGMHVVELMSGRMGVTHVGDRIGEVARQLLRGDLPGARVVSDGIGDPEHEHPTTVGVVTAAELAQLAAQGAADAPVQAVMHTDWPSVHPEDDVDRTLDVLTSGQAPAVVVRDARDEVLGLVTEADLRRAMAIASMPR